jgi:hypothetical protein
MILWTLHWYPDPKREFVRGEAVCHVEKTDSGYCVGVSYSGDGGTEEVHATIAAAQGSGDDQSRVDEDRVDDIVNDRSYSRSCEWRESDARRRLRRQQRT